jgi:5-hydroxyisourate hydrolase
MIDRISTHILDTARGKPALGVPALIERLEPGGRWLKVGAGTTDADGRISQLNGLPVAPGDLRITFDTADYFAQSQGVVFYPAVTVNVRLDGAREHYHIPVLLSTYSYSSYLGS